MFFAEKTPNIYLLEIFKELIKFIITLMLLIFPHDCGDEISCNKLNASRFHVNAFSQYCLTLHSQKKCESLIVKIFCVNLSMEAK